jgi:hypothetical protein
MKIEVLWGSPPLFLPSKKDGFLEQGLPRRVPTKHPHIRAEQQQQLRRASIDYSKT